MLLSQLIDPADLVSLNERQVEVLNSIAFAEIISSQTIKKELAGKLELAMKALKRAPQKGAPK